MLRDLAVKLQAMLRAESKARRVASDFEMLVQAKGLAKRPGPMERLDRGLLSLLHQHRGHGGVDLRRNARMCGDALCTDGPYRPSSPASPPSHHRPPHRASNPPDPANRPPLTCLPMHNTLLRTPLLHPPAPDSRGPAFHRARKDPSRQRQPGSCPLRGAPNHFVCSPSAENMARMVPPLDFT